MASELVGFYNDLDFEQLRIRRPSKFVFLCGGIIDAAGGHHVASLRDYLHRVRSFGAALNGNCSIVLAEEATRLYRDTRYGNLISFEEDVARIASVVVVIAESPGSLAELGAFTSNETIRRVLRVLMQEEHWEQESFIRYGPIQLLSQVRRSYVGVFPWLRLNDGSVDATSVAPIYDDIVVFLNNHLAARAATHVDPNDRKVRQFYVIYWIIYLAYAISPTLLYRLVRLLLPEMKNADIRNKMYCMQIAGWIGRASYSGTDYYYAMVDQDPFHYRYLDGVSDRDSIRRKQIVAAALRRAEKLPPHVRHVVAGYRAPLP